MSDPVNDAVDRLRSVELSRSQADELIGYIETRVRWQPARTVSEFAKRYMRGATPLQWQADYIAWFLDGPLMTNEHRTYVWPGRGGGKTMLRRAINAYLDDLERHGE